MCLVIVISPVNILNTRHTNTTVNVDIAVNLTSVSVVWTGIRCVCFFLGNFQGDLCFF